MYPLGSEKRPIIVKVRSQKRTDRGLEICNQYDWKCIIGLDPIEDISDLKKAVKEQMTPANPYDLCPCNSGKKYRYCCSKKRIELDI